MQEWHDEDNKDVLIWAVLFDDREGEGRGARVRYDLGWMGLDRGDGGEVGEQ